ncbi:MAG: hypothetical protein REJ50_06485 [Bordetella sp.]|nr:hypothetical protein [Bordetella sp.]
MLNTGLVLRNIPRHARSIQATSLCAAASAEASHALTRYRFRSHPEGNALRSSILVPLAMLPAIALAVICPMPGSGAWLAAEIVGIAMLVSALWFRDP